MRLWRTLAAGAVLSFAAVSPAFADAIGGTSGDDSLTGTSGNDTITAYAGDDLVHARAGDDLVFGDRGSDTIYGERGRDELRGGAGADVLVDGPRRDALIGGTGADTLYGRGAGLWFGKVGDDYLEISYPRGVHTIVRCGTGDDRLVFNEPYKRVSIKGCETVKIVPAG